MINCSIGVMAYNEEANIGLLLNSLLRQKLFSVNISEIIVVASGCIDNTVNIVKEFTKKDERIKLLTQDKRSGKISAINLYLERAKSEIVSIVNADLLLREDTIERLILPFSDPKIGMTGGRPVPLDKLDNFMGFAAHLLWGLHHEVALRAPKLGEIVAYRHLNNLQFPVDTVADEAVVEAIMTQRKFKLQYIPEAVFNNVNPQNLREFLKRRRNIYVGNIQQRKRTNYTASSIDISCLLKVVPFAVFKITGLNLKLILWSIAIACLELWARALATYDFYIKKRDHSIWEIAKTSKRKLP